MREEVLGKRRKRRRRPTSTKVKFPFYILCGDKTLFEHINAISTGVFVDSVHHIPLSFSLPKIELIAE